MPTKDLFYLVIILINAIAAILAWIAKLKWANEYSKAKDEIIRSKDSLIENLQNQIDYLKYLSPTKIKEYYETTRSQLEEYNDKLQEDLSKSNIMINEKEEEISKLKDQIKLNKSSELLSEKEELEKELSKLKLEVGKLEKEQLQTNGVIETLSQQSLTIVSALEKSRDFLNKLGNRSISEKHQHPHHETNLGLYFENDNLIYIPPSQNAIELLDPNKGNYNHPVRVRISPIVLNNEEPTTYPKGELMDLIVTQGRVSIDKLAEKEPGRGVRIEIIFFNELGSDFWALEHRFHKGCTYIRSYVPQLSSKEMDTVKVHIIPQVEGQHIPHLFFCLSLM